MENKFSNWDNVPLILNMRQVSNILGVHINTVKKLVTSGDLPHFKIGSATRIKKENLIEYTLR